MVAVALVAGCTSGSGDGSGGEPTASSSPPATSAGEETHEAAPGAVEVAPNGVTTAVGAPAESTEDEYFQACHAAKVWFEQRGGDPKTHMEDYLATLQSTDAAGPGTFHTPWAQLPPGRQSAAIVAVQAAADQLCG